MNDFMRSDDDEEPCDISYQGPEGICSKEATQLFFGMGSAFYPQK